LGGDSVLELGTEILGKSRDMAALRALLRKLSGRTHYLISAAALARDGSAFWRHVDRIRMTVRPLSDSFIDAYLAREGETLLGSVGGYRFEGFGVQLFESVEGDYFSILGLPLLPVLAALRAEGLLEK
jgi:septum formation protein